MKQWILFVFAALLGGIAVALWVPGSAPETPADAPAVAFDSSLPLEKRLLELERAVSQERQARQLLQEELVYLTDELDQLRARDERGRRVAEPEEVPDQQDRQQARDEGRDPDEGRRQRLIDAGMTGQRADWVMQQESRMQLQMLNARHAAERSGNFQDYRQQQQAAAEAFRNELGTEDYERYLEGTGRPTSVQVSNIMDSSPAQAAGLRPGDRILSYAGERIYSMRDLNRATLEGVAGQTVYLEIERDGMPMQIALPRGPVGISAGRRWRR